MSLDDPTCSTIFDELLRSGPVTPDALATSIEATKEQRNAIVRAVRRLLELRALSQDDDGKISMTMSKDQAAAAMPGPIGEKLKPFAMTAPLDKPVCPMCGRRFVAKDPGTIKCTECGEELTVTQPLPV